MQKQTHLLTGRRLAALLILAALLLSLARAAPSNAGPTAAIASQEVTLDTADLAESGQMLDLIAAPQGLTLANGVEQGSYQSDIIPSPLPFTSDIAPLWVADVPAGAAVTLETRLSQDGGATWSTWLENPQMFYPVRDNLRSGNLIWVGTAQAALQIRVTLQRSADGQPPAFSQLTLAFSDTSQGPTAADVAGQQAAVAAESCPPDQPAVVSRTDWGNPDGQSSPRQPPHYTPVTHVVIHQAETPNAAAPYQDYAGWVRSIWNFHANLLGWGDVGYNYLVDPNGVIYEGRAGGDDVIGIHDGTNRGSLGLGVLGCYGNCDNPHLEVATPSDATLSSLEALISWKFSQNEIDPLSSAPYAGHSETPVIAGGRDVSHTTSPGDNLYDALPVLRQQVSGRLDCDGSGPIQACRITEAVFNRDSYTVGDEINLTVYLVDDNDQPLSGAQVTALVEKEEILIQADDQSIDLQDQTGGYDGHYSNTALPGRYIFNLRAADPTGQRFLPCEAQTSVLVNDEDNGSVTPLPTDIVETPTPTPTTMPGTLTPTPTATTAPPTVTPTPIPTSTPTTAPDTPTPTPTPTPTATQPTGPVVSVNPDDLLLPLCTSQTTLTVSVENVANLAAVQLSLLYDPAVVQVIDADPSQAGVQVSIDPVFSNGFVARNSVDTVNGQIEFAATLLSGNKIDGNSTLITIEVAPQAAGITGMILSDVILADTNSTAISFTPRDGIIEVTSNCTGGNAVGQLQLQGRTDHSGIVVKNAAGQQTTTQADGSFSIAAGGPLRFEFPGYLPAQSDATTNLQSAEATLSLDPITLLAGDVNGDRAINIFDLAYVAQQYDGTDSLADLNADGRVDILDLVLAAGNFGATGPNGTS